LPLPLSAGEGRGSITTLIMQEAQDWQPKPIVPSKQLKPGKYEALLPVVYAALYSSWAFCPLTQFALKLKTVRDATSSLPTINLLGKLILRHR